MTADRRRAARVPCRIPAAGPAGIALIEDVSPLGARVRSSAPARVGQAVSWELRETNGRRIRLAGTVRRAQPMHTAYVLGCSFEGDAASSVAAWRLSKSVRSEEARFVVPKAPGPRPPRFAVRDHFGIRTLVAIIVGTFIFVVGSMIVLSGLALT